MGNFIGKFLRVKTARKVPEVLVYFWIIKLLTTALGESVSDHLVHTVNPFFAVALGAIGFAIALILQFSVRIYNAWIYWFAVTMVAIFGTMSADIVHIVLGVPYSISTIAFSITLVFIFVTWYKTEKTLSIHSIYTVRRELFYWLAVIITFALGTAAGDMTAVTFSLGYFASGILFLVLFVIPLISRTFLRTGEVRTFWTAYIMTRPLGASFADWFGRSSDLGGIGIGTGKTSIILTLVIILFVGFMAFTRKDVKGKNI